MDSLLQIIKSIPIDLVVVAVAVFSFFRFAWVMPKYTRVWDRLSKSLFTVFVVMGLTFLWIGVGGIFANHEWREIILWFFRGSITISVLWSQWELNRELKKVPSILFVRDRQWVRRRINNIELIRELLKTHSDTPEGLMEALEAELAEMYRFKEVVWEEDKKSGVDHEPEWFKNPYYVEKHVARGAEAERDVFATLLEHHGVATPGDAYPGSGGKDSK